MKQDLQKRLNFYAATAGAVAATGALNAQIVYTDVNPDTIVADTVLYDLDIDNNGQPELRFETITYQSTIGVVHSATVVVLGDTNNAVIGSLYSGQYPLPYALNNGDSISSTNANWQRQTINFGYQYLAVQYGSTTIANWAGATDKFLGVRFKIGANTHYGWARLSVTAIADSIIIKDYAYQLMPGVGLTAGLLTGMQEQTQTVANIYAYDNVLHINRQENAPATVTVYNMMGDAVLAEQTTESNYSTSLGDLPTGIYMVMVKTEEGEAMDKIYVR